MDKKRRVLLMKVGVWALGLFPLAQVGWWLRDGLFGLGADPIQKLMDHAGWWTLTLLMATLAITPIRRITGRNELVKLRRPMGLFAFFWATVHFGVYLTLDQAFEWYYIWEDIAERPFITVGFAGWLILLSLAFTSTKGWIRRLGKKWTMLHRGVYVVGLLGVIHFYWKVKADTREPLIFAAIFVALMALRMQWTERRRRRARASSKATSSSGSSEARGSGGPRDAQPEESQHAGDGDGGSRAAVGAAGATGSGARSG